MRKHMLTAALLALLLLLETPLASAAETTGAQYDSAEAETHESYFSGSPDGLFYPEKDLTRAELAQLLSRLVDESNIETNDSMTFSGEFSDVEADDWYAPAVRTVTALGIMNGENGNFMPNAPVDRGTCAAALVYFLPEEDGASPEESEKFPEDGEENSEDHEELSESGEEPPEDSEEPTKDSGDNDELSDQESIAFPDVPRTYWAYEAILRTVQAGLFRGYEDGGFYPTKSLRRSEAAVVFNRLLGRSPDAAALETAANLQIFPDVPRWSWAYGDIMEATNAHECVHLQDGGECWTKIASARPIARPDGYYRINGALYRVLNGRYLYDAVDGVLTFDRNGRYTTGDSALDEKLNELVETYAAPVDDRIEKLRALYVYVRDNFSYLKRPLVEADQTGWEAEYASFFLEHGKGNCFSFSATYCLLCRELGEDAVAVVGLLGKNQSPHGWVLFRIDGVSYMCDPQLEWRYLHDYKLTGYDLFMVLPDEAAFDYVWQSAQP